MRHFSPTLALLSLAVAAVPVHATVVFFDDFDTDHTANWTFTPSSGTAGDQPNDGIGSDANVFFDYSSVGIPSANGTGGTTTGMKFAANLPGTNIFSGVTMGLNSQTFDFASKSYKISAKVWLNYYGGTFSGTTEEVMMGIGANAGTSQFVGDNFNSVMFSTSTDGDTSSDWRAYKTPWPVQGPTEANPGQPAPGRVQQGESGVYASDPTGAHPGASGAGNDLDSANPYYVQFFPGGEVPPPAQQALFANQSPTATGMPASPGTVAFAWHTWTIESTLGGGPIKFSVDGHLIATIQGGTINPYVLGGNSIYFGIYDINTSSPPAGFDADKLLFGLVDNVMVEDVTLYGDANLNGKIDADDFALTDRGRAMALTGWSNGDFNNDSVIDAQDYLLLDTSFLLQGGFSPSFLALREAQFGADYVGQLLAAVPEPAVAPPLSFLAASVLARRRQRLMYSPRK